MSYQEGNSSHDCQNKDHDTDCDPDHLHGLAEPDGSIDGLCFAGGDLEGAVTGVVSLIKASRIRVIISSYLGDHRVSLIRYAIRFLQEEEIAAGQLVFYHVGHVAGVAGLFVEGVEVVLLVGFEGELEDAGDVLVDGGGLFGGVDGFAGGLGAHLIRVVIIDALRSDAFLLHGKPSEVIEGESVQR